LRNRQHTESQPLGLDEIMIINPGATPIRLVALHSFGGLANPTKRPPLFLGENGIVYALHGAEEPIRSGDLRLGAYGAFESFDVATLADDLSDLEIEQ
jgi:hypothetical protein